MFSFHRNVRNAKRGVVFYVSCSNGSLIIRRGQKDVRETNVLASIFPGQRTAFRMVNLKV
jgi:hypothetical protein